MASGKEIKNRIKSVKNTKKITKAMELVAASKMKRAVSSTLASRMYAMYSWDVLTSISKNKEEMTNIFFKEKNPSTSSGLKSLLILITSNRGLCGGYNSQVLKQTILKLKDIGSDVDLVTIGKKGDVAMRRVGQNVVASFDSLPENINLSDIIPISKLVLDEFKNGTYKNVMVAYTDFVSALTQKPNIKQILPISQKDLNELINTPPRLSGTPPSQGGEESNPRLVKEGAGGGVAYLFEGDKEKLLDTLAEKLSRMQIYQMLLESNASEQSSRMVAMKNASEAAGEMIDDLTLAFNKARQAGITQEISEISAGMASVS